jgi:hypothetical protein
LYPAIPQITVDVVIWAWRHDQERNPPRSGQCKTNEDDSAWDALHPKQLADGKEVGNAGSRQANQERPCANSRARTGK